MIIASTAARRPLLRDRLVRVVAGDSEWGWLDVWPSRYGFTHYRLVVCPPGTTATERALLRAWRAWPMIAVITGGLLLLTTDAAGLVPSAVGTIAAVGVAAIPLALARATRRQRPAVRVRHGGTDDVDGSRRPVGDMELIDRSWTRLAAADRAKREGAISPAEHELVWTMVWNETAPAPRHGRHRTTTEALQVQPHR